MEDAKFIVMESLIVAKKNSGEFRKDFVVGKYGGKATNLVMEYCKKFGEIKYSCSERSDSLETRGREVQAVDDFISRIEIEGLGMVHELLAVLEAIFAFRLCDLACQYIFDHLIFNDYAKYCEAFAFEFLFPPYFNITEIQNVEEMLLGFGLPTLEEIDKAFKPKIPFTSEQLRAAESENKSVRVGENLGYKTNKRWVEELLIKVEKLTLEWRTNWRTSHPDCEHMIFPHSIYFLESRYQEIHSILCTLRGWLNCDEVQLKLGKRNTCKKSNFEYKDDQTKDAESEELVSGKLRDDEQIRDDVISSLKNLGYLAADASCAFALEYYLFRELQLEMGKCLHLDLLSKDEEVLIFICQKKLNLYMRAAERGTDNMISFVGNEEEFDRIMEEPVEKFGPRSLDAEAKMKYFLHYKKFHSAMVNETKNQMYLGLNGGKESIDQMDLGLNGGKESIEVEKGTLEVEKGTVKVEKGRAKRQRTTS